MCPLLPHQQKALEHVAKIAVRNTPEVRRTINNILARAQLNERDFDEAIQSIRSHAQVVLNFHPERLSVTGKTVAQGLWQDGIYKNQYETGLSSGSPSAFRGGDRDVWEKRLFGGAYHGAGVSPADRPKYGALEIMYHADGAAPRFGSCFFVLHTDVSKRSTFTFGGSQEDEAIACTGTLDTIEIVIAPLLREVENGSGALGVDNLTVADLMRQLTRGLSTRIADQSTRPLGKALDSFLEAQIHGTIDLHQDVEKLVADPAFRGSPTEKDLRAICSTYDILLEWHPGFTLPVKAVPERFRGYATGPLARRIAKDGILNARNIGEAANSLKTEPDLWKDLGPSREALTAFRRLWHVLVMYGEPSKQVNARTAKNL